MQKGGAFLSQGERLKIFGARRWKCSHPCPKSKSATVSNSTLITHTASYLMHTSLSLLHHWLSLFAKCSLCLCSSCLLLSRVQTTEIIIKPSMDTISKLPEGYQHVVSIHGGMKGMCNLGVQHTRRSFHPQEDIVHGQRGILGCSNLVFFNC